MNKYSSYNLFQKMKVGEFKSTYERCLQISPFVLKSKSDYLEYFDSSVNFIKFMRVVSFETLESVYFKKPKEKYGSYNYFEKENIYKDIVQELPTRMNSLHWNEKHDQIKIIELEPRKLGNRMYQKIIERSKRREHLPPKYAFEEFYEWLTKKTKFLFLFSEWVRKGKDSKDIPSVNRLKNDIGYLFENMEVITWGENDAINLCEKQNNMNSNNDGHWYRKTPVDSDAYHLIRNEFMVEYLKKEKELIIEFGNTLKVKFGKNTESDTSDKILFKFSINQLKLFSEQMRCIKLMGPIQGKVELVNSILVSLPCPMIRGSHQRPEVFEIDEFMDVLKIS